MFDWFGSDNFDKMFKASLKKFDLQTGEKKSDNVFMITNGRSELEFDISDVRRKFMKNKHQQITDEFASRAAYELSLEDRLLSFTNAQAFLRLIVMNGNEIRDNMVSADFAGSLKKAVCYPGEGTDIYMLDRKYLRKWAVPAEVLFAVADRNMGRLLSKVKYTCSQIGNGVNVMEFETGGDPLVVSMMLCQDFRELVTEKLGPRFLVAAPSRENMIAVQEIPNNILSGLGEAVVKDYKWADNPLSTDVFYYTPSDITVAGHFNTD